MRGDAATGWTAIDDFIFLSDIPDCRVRVSTDFKALSTSYPISQPDNAIPSGPTEPPPTEYPPTFTCGFESDFCGFEVTGEQSFKFSIVQGGSMTEEGPTEDSSGSRWLQATTLHCAGQGTLPTPVSVCLMMARTFRQKWSLS